MPNAMVDVNVHPNKLEVRFSNENLIYQSVKGAVQDSFSVSPLVSAPSLFDSHDEKPASTSVVRVIDTQTPEGIEQAQRETKQQTDAVQNRTQMVRAHVVPVAVAGRLDEEENKETQKASDSKLQTTLQKPTQAQQTEFTSFVTKYFGGAALRESSVPGSFRPTAQTEEKKPVGASANKQPALHHDKQEETLKAAQAIVSESATALNDEKGNASEKPAVAEDKPVDTKTIEVKSIDAKPQEPVQESMLADQSKEKTAEDPLHGYKMVGVAFDTYIILQNDKQMLFIDQHAAHERILYERLMRQIDQGAGSQVLMVAQVVHVTPQDKAKIEQYAEEIKAAGFDIEPFGEDAYQIRAVPNVLGVPQSRGAFLDMVDHLGELRVLSTQQKRRDAILQIACKKAIKGGDKLSLEEIEPLISDMLATNAPPTCPHGRPLVVVLGKNELEKRFRRINN